MNIRVDCYAGYRGEETPRCIRFSQRRIRIIQVLDRWLSTDHRYFKVLGDDDGIYIIRHDMIDWRWELHYFEQKDG